MIYFIENDPKNKGPTLDRKRETYEKSLYLLIVSRDSRIRPEQAADCRAAVRGRFRPAEADTSDGQGARNRDQKPAER